MESVYIDSSLPEKETKIRCHFGECIMMENAAAALEKAVLGCGAECSVLVLCGGGNNGGDGLALARRIYGKCRVSVFLAEAPRTEEARIQYEMAKAVGVPFVEKDAPLECYTVFADCLFGTGFHGKLSEDYAALILRVNEADGVKIACDIPSGIDKNGCIETKDAGGSPVAFRADKTVTMGALKTALFSDEAKDFTGTIEKAGLGVSDFVFEKNTEPDAYIIEKSDIQLPHRKKKSAHKGMFGHTAVVIGEKPGAAILAGTAALRFGTGLVTCITDSSAKGDGVSFLMPPELMTGNSFPEKTTSVLLGSGLGTDKNSIVSKTVSFIYDMEKPSAVFDADFFSYPEAPSVLKKLNDRKNAQIIITPHPKELCMLINSCLSEKYEVSFTVSHRFELSRRWSKAFPNIVLVAKGANTYIFRGGRAFICSCGTNALAKAGSGDVLAGLCASLLAQGYDALEAAKTAVYAHASSSTTFAPDYALTPLLLIDRIETSL